jgi:hypothetical protein
VADPEDLEFFELLNTGSESVSLEGVQITQFATNPYTFGSINLAAGERIIVARTPAVFQAVYGTSINVAPTGYATANLSNGGERIALLGPLGEALQDFTYDDIAPWPTTPDGGGRSLEIIDPLGDATSSANWRASSRAGGSPGTDTATLGDYDLNGAVEEADHSTWMSSFGRSVPVTMGADGSGDGVVDAADYVVWKKFVNVPQSPGGSVISTAAGDEVFTTHISAAAGRRSNLEAALPASTVSSPHKLVLNSSAGWLPHPQAAASILRTRLTFKIGSPEQVAWAANLRTIERTIALIDVAYHESEVDASPVRLDECFPVQPASLESRRELDAEIWSEVSWVAVRSWPRLSYRRAT